MQPFRDNKASIGLLKCQGIRLLDDLAIASTSTLISSNSYIPVNPIRQRQTWDCGLAATYMAITACSATPPSLSSLEALCGTSSVWTIDLAHLLRKCNIDVSYTTTYIGPNPAYQEEKFYAEHMQHDVARVSALFEAAESVGIALHQVSVSSTQLRCLLSSSKYVVIALVDKTKLMQPPAEDAPYTGHYILIHGYDRLKDEFVVKDPAVLSENDVRLSTEMLDAARKAHGTDEDLLFIHLPPMQLLGSGSEMH